MKIITRNPRSNFERRSKRVGQKAGNRTLVLVAMLVLFVLIGSEPAPPPANAQSTTITLDPPSGSLYGCDTYDITVRIDDVTDLYAADVRIAFDPAQLEVIQLLPSYDLLQPDYIVRNMWDNVTGLVWYAATQINPTPPANGSGELVTIRFRARSSGTANLTFSYSKLAEGNGTTIPSTASGGAIQTTGPSVPTIAIEKLGSTDVRLSWSAVAGIADYHLYRGTEAYFTPTAPPYLSTDLLSVDDEDVLGDTATNYFYLVKAACPNGYESDASNRVGEYDYALASPNAYNYNDIAMVLDVPGVDSASDVADYAGSYVRMVSKYHASSQAFQTYIVGNPATDFGVSLGQFVFLVTDGTAPLSMALVGDVPDPGAVSFDLISASPAKYNLISLPLDQGHLSSASDVANDVGSGVLITAHYLNDSQAFQMYIPGNPSTDFSLVAGEPFALILTTGAPSEWP